MGANHKYISRVPNGYQVRISIRDRIALSRFFSDRKHGGRESAQLAAREFRDATLQAHGLIGLLHRRGASPRGRHANNRSGVIGVIRFDYWRRLSTGARTRYTGWRGYGMINKKAWSRTFSIHVYGEERAFQLACRERYRRQGVLHVVGDPDSLPCLPDCPYRLTGTAAGMGTPQNGAYWSEPEGYSG